MALFGLGKKKEEERQKELERQKEFEKQKELERQKELEQKKALEERAKEHVQDMKNRQEERAEKPKEEFEKGLSDHKLAENLAIIQEIKDLISDCNGIVLVEYRGMIVQQDTDLRTFLRNINVNYKIFKNTHFRKAIENTDYENLLEYSQGAVSAIFYKDPEQLGLLYLYCNNAGVNSIIKVASYQKNLIMPKDMKELMDSQVQHIKEKYLNDEINEEPEIEVESDTEVFSVILKSSGPNALEVIKFARIQKNLDLLGVRNLVQSAPCVYEKDLSKEEAFSLAEDLRKLGAEAEIMAVEASENDSETVTGFGYKVEITNLNNNKMQAIRLVMHLTDLGVTESKELVASINTNGSAAVLTDVDYDTAMNAVNQFQSENIEVRVTEPKFVDNSQAVKIETDSRYDQFFLELLSHNDDKNNNEEEFDLYLTDPGENIVNCIRVIREITGFGLKESKELATDARNMKMLIKTFDDKESLMAAKKKFDEIGAKAEI